MRSGTSNLNTHQFNPNNTAETIDTDDLNRSGVDTPQNDSSFIIFKSDSRENLGVAPVLDKVAFQAKQNALERLEVENFSTSNDPKKSTTFDSESRKKILILSKAAKEFIAGGEKAAKRLEDEHKEAEKLHNDAIAKIKEFEEEKGLIRDEEEIARDQYYSEKLKPLKQALEVTEWLRNPSLDLGRKINLDSDRRTLAYKQEVKLGDKMSKSLQSWMKSEFFTGKSAAPQEAIAALLENAAREDEMKGAMVRGVKRFSGLLRKFKSLGGDQDTLGIQLPNAKITVEDLSLNRVKDLGLRESANKKVRDLILEQVASERDAEALEIINQIFKSRNLDQYESISGEINSASKAAIKVLEEQISLLEIEQKRQLLVQTLATIKGQWSGLKELVPAASVDRLIEKTRLQSSLQNDSAFNDSNIGSPQIQESPATASNRDYTNQAVAGILREALGEDREESEVINKALMMLETRMQMPHEEIQARLANISDEIQNQKRNIEQRRGQGPELANSTGNDSSFLGEDESVLQGEGDELDDLQLSRTPLSRGLGESESPFLSSVMSPIGVENSPAVLATKAVLSNVGSHPDTIPAEIAAVNLVSPTKDALVDSAENDRPSNYGYGDDVPDLIPSPVAAIRPQSANVVTPSTLIGSNKSLLRSDSVPLSGNFMFIEDDSTSHDESGSDNIAKKLFSGNEFADADLASIEENQVLATDAEDAEETETMFSISAESSRSSTPRNDINDESQNSTDVDADVRNTSLQEPLKIQAKLRLQAKLEQNKTLATEVEDAKKAIASAREALCKFHKEPQSKETRGIDKGRRTEMRKAIRSSLGMKEDADSLSRKAQQVIKEIQGTLNKFGTSQQLEILEALSGGGAAEISDQNASKALEKICAALGNLEITERPRMLESLKFRHSPLTAVFRGLNEDTDPNYSIQNNYNQMQQELERLESNPKSSSEQQVLEDQKAFLKQITDTTKTIEKRVKNRVVNSKSATFKDEKEKQKAVAILGTKALEWVRQLQGQNGLWDDEVNEGGKFVQELFSSKEIPEAGRKYLFSSNKGISEKDLRSNKLFHTLRRRIIAVADAAVEINTPSSSTKSGTVTPLIGSRKSSSILAG